MNDNNYDLSGQTAGTARKGDIRYRPSRSGKDIVLDEANEYSPGRDLIYYRSSRTPGIRLAMLVTKPAAPGSLLATTHGWHMDIGGFSYLDAPTRQYLNIAVDMRGRKYSEGKADCNGLELYDVIDAIEYAAVLYREYIIDPAVKYFDAGSGGGGNAYAIAGKFPDYFAAITALCGISDYALWYRNDAKGEFRDELDVWIGTTPDAGPLAYRSRSGLTLVENLLAPLYIAHGETDIRVPVDHARNYVARAKTLGTNARITYRELAGVGDHDHWGKATDEERTLVARESEENRKRNRIPLSIPRRGTMIVGGYLVTKEFSVFLNSIDAVARLDYDLDAERFSVTDTSSGYTVERKR